MEHFKPATPTELEVMLKTGENQRYGYEIPRGLLEEVSTRSMHIPANTGLGNMGFFLQGRQPYPQELDRLAREPGADINVKYVLDPDFDIKGEDAIPKYGIRVSPHFGLDKTEYVLNDQLAQYITALSKILEGGELAPHIRHVQANVAPRITLLYHISSSGQRMPGELFTVEWVANGQSHSLATNQIESRVPDAKWDKLDAVLAQFDRSTDGYVPLGHNKAVFLWYLANSLKRS